METAFCAIALREGFIPGSAHITKARSGVRRPECHPGDATPAASRRAEQQQRIRPGPMSGIVLASGMRKLADRYRQPWSRAQHRARKGGGGDVCWTRAWASGAPPAIPRACRRVPASLRCARPRCRRVRGRGIFRRRMAMPADSTSSSTTPAMACTGAFVETRLCRLQPAA